MYFTRRPHSPFEAWVNRSRQLNEGENILPEPFITLFTTFYVYGIAFFVLYFLGVANARLWALPIAPIYWVFLSFVYFDKGPYYNTPAPEDSE